MRKEPTLAELIKKSSNKLKTIGKTFGRRTWKAVQEGSRNIERSNRNMKKVKRMPTRNNNFSPIAWDLP